MSNFPECGFGRCLIETNLPDKGKFTVFANTIGEAYSVALKIIGAEYAQNIMRISRLI